MLEERGKVVDIRGETAIVEIKKGKSAHCSSCGLCNKGQNGRAFLEVVNSGSVKIGDTVLVRIDDTALLKGAMFIYGLPLLGFVAGVCIASLMHPWYLRVLVFLMVFIGIWWYGLKKGNEIGRRRKPEIVNIGDGIWT